MLVPQLAGEGALGALLAKDAVLLGGEFGTPFGVGPGLGGLALGLMHGLMMHPLCGGLMTSRRHADGRPVVPDPDAGWSRQADRPPGVSTPDSTVAGRLGRDTDACALERRNQSPRASPPDPARHRTNRPSPPRRGRPVGGAPGTRPGVQPAAPARALFLIPSLIVLIVALARRAARSRSTRLAAWAIAPAVLGTLLTLNLVLLAWRLIVGRAGVPRHAPDRPDRAARGHRAGRDRRRRRSCRTPWRGTTAASSATRSARSSRARSCARRRTGRPARPAPSDTERINVLLVGVDATKKRTDRR